MIYDLWFYFIRARIFFKDPLLEQFKPLSWIAKTNLKRTVFLKIKYYNELSKKIDILILLKITNYKFAYIINKPREI